MNPTVDQVVAHAREQGYRIERVEQVRANRWLLTLKDGTDALILVLVQKRLLVGSADVQDLAELLALSRFDRGILFALDGTFSPVAQQTVLELKQTQITLCTGLSPAAHPPQSKPAFESL